MAEIIIPIKPEERLYNVRLIFDNHIELRGKYTANQLFHENDADCTIKLNGDKILDYRIREREDEEVEEVDMKARKKCGTGKKK